MPENYHRHLNTGMANVVKKIVSFYKHTDWKPITIAAALHHYIKNKTRYEKRGSKPRRAFRSPRETWKNGGNCQEKSVLLASLFHAVKGVKSRLISVRSPRNDVSDHLLAQAGFKRGRENAKSDLKHFHQKCPQIPSLGTISWENGKHMDWLIADPEMSEYIGDTSSLERKQYIEAVDSGWNWHHVKYTQTIQNTLA